MIKKWGNETQIREEKNQLLLKMWGKNESTEGLVLKNKIGPQKSTCVVCDSRKSTFLKPIKPLKSKKIVFANCQNKCKLIV